MTEYHSSNEYDFDPNAVFNEVEPNQRFVQRRAWISVAAEAAAGGHEMEVARVQALEKEQLEREQPQRDAELHARNENERRWQNEELMKNAREKKRQQLARAEVQRILAERKGVIIEQERRANQGIMMIEWPQAVTAKALDWPAPEMYTVMLEA